MKFLQLIIPSFFIIFVLLFFSSEAVQAACATRALCDAAPGQCASTCNGGQSCVIGDWSRCTTQNPESPPGCCQETTWTSCCTPGGGGGTNPPGGGGSSGGCSGVNPECRTDISNCGQIGKVGGSGSCTNGGLCCVQSSGGGGSSSSCSWKPNDPPGCSGEGVFAGASGVCCSGLDGAVNGVCGCPPKCALSVTTEPFNIGIGQTLPLSVLATRTSSFGSVPIPYIYRKTALYTTTNLGPANSSQQTFNITGVTQGSTYIDFRADLQSSTSRGYCIKRVIVNVGSTVQPPVSTPTPPATSMPSAPPSAVSVDLRVNGGNGPISITSGSSVTLSWTTNNATSCSATGSWSGTKTVNGSQTIGPLNSNSNYVLSCSGISGSASDSVAVTIAIPPQCTTPPPRDPPTPTCDSAGAGIGSVTWQWDAVADVSGFVTQYEVDIVDSNGNIIINNNWAAAATYNCTGGGMCRYVTALPKGSYRSRIRARGTCTDSTVAVSNTISVLDCPTCNISLAPDPLTVIAGEETTLVANVDIQNGTPVQVDFSSNNTNVVVTTPDTTEPFTSTIRGNALGASQIRGTVTGRNANADECSMSDTSTITITPPPPWWQAMDADVTSNGNIQSLIPATCGLPQCDPNFIKNGIGGFPGVAVYGGGFYDFTQSATTTGSPSSRNWLANTSYQGRRYDYDYVQSIIPTDVFINNFNSNLTGGTASKGYIWYQSNGNATLNNVTVNGNNRIILIVNGNLTINDRINIANPGEGFLLVIVNGDIVVSPSVFDASAASPAIWGIYLAGGQFRSGISDQRLTIRGAVTAWEGFSLQRDLEDANINTPAETFEYDPRLMLLFPPFLVRDSIVWREILP